VSGRPPGRVRHTVEAEVVVHDAHDGLAAALARLAGEAEAGAGGLAAEALGEPADEEAEAGAAHAHKVLFGAEAGRERVALDVQREQQRREVVQRRGMRGGQRRRELGVEGTGWDGRMS
jgi:hypothetical protein